MAISSWNIIGEGPESTRVVLRLWGDAELDARAAAFRGAAALCESGFAVHVEHSTSRDGLSADVVYELGAGQERGQREAVGALMRSFASSLPKAGPAR